jgi:hypothetical protein
LQPPDRATIESTVGRATLRYGATASKADKRLRGRIRKLLRKAGFRKTGAAEWQAGEIPAEAVTQALRDVADEIDREPADTHRHVSVTIDGSGPA